VSNERLITIIRDLFPLTPRSMIEHLRLRRPIYQPTAAYGHFGRKPVTVADPVTGQKVELFTWEKTDMVAELKKALR